MRNLDARGIIAAVEIAIYVPLLITSIILVKRHGFKRSGGWLFFVIFSIGKLLSHNYPSILTTYILFLVRIVGASIHIAAELESSYNVTLHIIYGVLEGAGLQPLLGATLGFLGTVYEFLVSRINVSKITH